MRMSAPGTDEATHGLHRGFTLLELLVVIAIMALATAGVSLALRDSTDTQLEREAQRLGALLEAGRAQARMASAVVRWRATPTGFVFEGLPGAPLPTQWLGDDVRASGTTALVLGPEPIIVPQQVQLVSISNPSRSLTLATDGIRPFAVAPPPPSIGSP
jgi:general secretion pathway protein H